MRIDKQSPWEIQKSVIFALFIRELKSRFGQFKLGYIWAILDPAFGILVLCMIRVVMGNGKIGGLEFPVFFASGMLIYKMFVNIGTSAIGLVESHLSLMNYQRIKPMDPIVARAILEMLILAAAMVTIMGGLYWAGFQFEWNNTLGFIAVFALMSIFSFGIGCIFATASLFFQELKKIAPIAIQPLFFISGIFFPANSLPENILPYLLWNPILHAIELGRSMMFTEYATRHGSWSYLSVSALTSLALGLALFRLYRHKLVTSGSVKLS